MRNYICYAWENGLFDSSLLVTTSGESVDVISAGVRSSEGDLPDFMDVKLRIGDKLWVGSLCCDIKSSDWMRNNNHCKPIFDSVIMYIVEVADLNIYHKSGEAIPMLTLPNWSETKRVLNRYIIATRDMPCATGIAKISSLTMASWMQSLAFERMHDKQERIKGWFDSSRGSWEDICYATFARNMGFGIDSDMMEALARRVPLKLLQRISDSQTQIEALLFGQAGVLRRETFIGDEYYQRLCVEYEYLSKKFALTPINHCITDRYAGNPRLFPFRRIAVLAHFIAGGFRLVRDIIERESLSELRKLFNVEFTGYWRTHSSFGKPSGVTSSRVISAKSVDIVIINSVVPIKYFYGEYTEDFTFSESAIHLLESLSAENNGIIRIFRNLGVRANDALTSQAMIQLYKKYCTPKRCSECRIMAESVLMECKNG